MDKNTMENKGRVRMKGAGAMGETIWPGLPTPPFPHARPGGRGRDRFLKIGVRFSVKTGVLMG